MLLLINYLAPWRSPYVLSFGSAFWGRRVREETRQPITEVALARCFGRDISPRASGGSLRGPWADVASAGAHHAQHLKDTGGGLPPQGFRQGREHLGGEPAAFDHSTVRYCARSPTLPPATAPCVPTAGVFAGRTSQVALSRLLTDTRVHRGATRIGIGSSSFGWRCHSVDSRTGATAQIAACCAFRSDCGMKRTTLRHTLRGAQSSGPILFRQRSIHRQKRDPRQMSPPSTGRAAGSARSWR